MAGRRIELILDYGPSANRYARHGKGRTYTHKDVLAYRASVSAEGKLNRVRPFPKSKRVSVTAKVYRKRKAGDLDNRIKPLLDALEGVAYENDSQVTELHLTRHDDKAWPRIEVVVEEAA